MGDCIYHRPIGGFKSSVLEQLEKEGFHVVDTDYGYTAKVVQDGIEEVIWDRGKITDLLNRHRDVHLFISGCYSNQGEFHHRFDHVVLLTADLDVMLARVDQRVTHDFGKDPAGRGRILEDYKNVLPLLRKRATMTIDTTNLRVGEVCTKLKELVEGGS